MSKGNGMRGVSSFVKKTRTAVDNMVARAVLRVVNNAGGLQALHIALLQDETRDNCERFQEFGFDSTPLPDAEVVVVFVGGQRDHPLVVACDDRRYRLKSNAGGSTMYDASGNFIHIKNDGTIEINSATRVDITCPLVRMTGDLEVEGDITDRYTTDATTVRGIRELYNIHRHPENDNGGPTNQPIEQLPAT